MVILGRIFIFIALSMTMVRSMAQDAFAYQLVCSPESFCDEIRSKVSENFEKTEGDRESFLRSLALDKGVRFLEVRQEKINNKEVFFILIERKPQVSSIEFFGPDELDMDRLLKISQLQEGVYLSDQEIQDSEARVEAWLSDHGYLSANLDVKVSENGVGQVNLVGTVSYKDKIILKRINIEGDKNKLAKELVRPLVKFEGKPFSRVNFKLGVDKLAGELKKEGYFHSIVNFTEVGEGRDKNINLKIDLGPRTQFSFSGNRILGKDQLSSVLEKAINEGVSILRPEDLVSALEKAYSEIGLYRTEISFYKANGNSSYGGEVSTYFFRVKEGKKSSLSKLTFIGNLKLDIEALKSVYYKSATILAKRDFVDEKFLNSFSTILKNYYLQNGFVFIDVSQPRLVFGKDKSSAEVTYSIKERQQCVLEKINLEGISDEVKPKVLEKLVNKVGSPLNVIELENDLSRALDQLREEGFFYATITNLNKNSVVTYEANYTRSQLNLIFKPGKKALFETAVLAGNRVTKDKVLLREIKLQKGDKITPERIKKIRDRINALGIFGRVQVIPLVVNKLSNDDFNKTNLIIQVQEKKFGRGEIAPGYRTDIGAKISLTLTKSNVLGLNDSGTLKFQLNRRFSLRQFDATRRASRKHRIEGISRFSYNFPYLFNSVDFSSNFSIQRRRFFAFDADIYRISPQVTKQIVDKPGMRIGASLKYQYERIRQFDATQLRDRATFEIGSITPGLTFDFRDSPISPRSGAYFGLSWEFANPYFGSQKDQEIEINFSKVISRNRFYVPLYSKTLVLAVSLAAGMQQNYATGQVLDASGTLRTRGYIPSIKVFRLDGFDLVRGFADVEINRLRNGNDITEERVDGKAFFTNLKVEPRYYMSDSFVFGTFFDAGKIHLNKFKPLDLRTSAGLTFKFLTPVGTLDFDYGVKLRRIRSGLNQRESFGRFHLSIGYF